MRQETRIIIRPRYEGLHYKFKNTVLNVPLLQDPQPVCSLWDVEVDAVFIFSTFEKSSAVFAAKDVMGKAASMVRAMRTTAGGSVASSAAIHLSGKAH
jgi:hypothetical protein